jgi:hypothetical protein
LWGIPRLPCWSNPENPPEIYAIDFNITTAVNLTTGAGTTATAVTATASSSEIRSSALVDY